MIEKDLRVNGTLLKLFASFNKGRIEYKRGETNVYFP